MKQDIHPKYFKTTATCACGATYEIGSTRENIRVEICSKCHPLFTGTEKLLDAEGRVEKFKRKVALAAEKEQMKKAGTDRKHQEIEAREKKDAEEKRTVIEKLEAIRKGEFDKHIVPQTAPVAPASEVKTVKKESVKAEAKTLARPKAATKKPAAKKATKKTPAKKPAKKKSK